MNELKKRIRVPDEVLYLIVDACTPKFKIIIMENTYKGADFNMTRTRRSMIEVLGIPDLTYLKLVNRRFYDQVWPVLCASFTGKIQLENTSGDCEAAMVARTNELFTGRLKFLAHCVTRIRDWQDDINAYSKLKIDIFPALQVVTFHVDVDDISMIDFKHYNTIGGSKHDDELNNEIIIYIAEKLDHMAREAHPSKILGLLRDRGVKIIFAHNFETEMGDRNVYYYVNVSNPRNLSIVGRYYSGWAEPAEYSGGEDTDWSDWV